MKDISDIDRSIYCSTSKYTILWHEEGRQPMEFDVKFYAQDEADDALLRYAVIVSRFDGKWIYCKHRLRGTLEIPGGHREKGETMLDAAKRELFEETGATEFTITPVCAFGVARGEADGMLFTADISALGPLPESEIERIELLEEPPPVESHTYPLIQPLLFKRCRDTIR